MIQTPRLGLILQITTMSLEEYHEEKDNGEIKVDFDSGWSQS